jgi:hypothetical protein
LSTRADELMVIRRHLVVIDEARCLRNAYRPTIAQIRPCECAQSSVYGFSKIHWWSFMAS